MGDSEADEKRYGMLDETRDRLEARIAELEEALDEIQSAAFPLSTARNGNVETMCVPIGAWDNAMRFIEVKR